jgi:TMEM164 family
VQGVINQWTELAAGLHQEVLGRVDVADRGLEQLDCEFLGSWGIHLFVICADIYLIYAGGCGSGGGSYRMVVVVTLVRAAVTFTVNAIVKADYAFSTESPHRESAACIATMAGAYIHRGHAHPHRVGPDAWPWERARPQAKGGPPLV